MATSLVVVKDLGIGEAPKFFSVTKGQLVVKDQIIIQRNSEYLNGQRPAMMFPQATEFDLRYMGQGPGSETKL
jgi:hypothetical protein